MFISSVHGTTFASSQTCIRASNGRQVAEPAPGRYGTVPRRAIRESVVRPRRNPHYWRSTLLASRASGRSSVLPRKPRHCRWFAAPKIDRQTCSRTYEGWSHTRLTSLLLSQRHQGWPVPRRHRVPVQHRRAQENHQPPIDRNQLPASLSITTRRRSMRSASTTSGELVSRAAAAERRSSATAAGGATAAPRRRLLLPGGTRRPRGNRS